MPVAHILNSTDRLAALPKRLRTYLETFIGDVEAQHPAQPQFHQAVREVVGTLGPCLSRNPLFLEGKILERLVEPDRVFMFRVPWQDDHGGIHINRGYRVEFNNAIGPYKGGLRFHPTVNLGVLKFLGFEQILKNSLTTLPMGGAKGGSDFDPKGRSDAEVMRFCQSFMNELYPYIGSHIDIPAGDIGVGGREIGYLFGQYKKLTHSFEGVLTGKGVNWGGSLIRPEATGYGCVYFAEEMLKTRKLALEGMTVAVSGSGNVAQYAIEKVAQLGGKVITASDSGGTIVDPEGIQGERLLYLMELKNAQRGRIKDYANRFRCQYHEGRRPWFVKCDVALPCATENEISGREAELLVKNHCKCVAEGANMPSTAEAIKVWEEHGILYGPGKAANAGGVATSGLELTQNSLRFAWSRDEVDERLHQIMRTIHEQCAETAREYGAPGDYLLGANIAGFQKVAHAMLDQGLV